jgi:acetyl esterase/lipase
VKEGSATGPAVLYLHGGGMISGSVALYDGPVSRYVSSSGVSMLAVDYRLAPEHPYPTPVEDCYIGCNGWSNMPASSGSTQRGSQ